MNRATMGCFIDGACYFGRAGTYGDYLSQTRWYGAPDSEGSGVEFKVEGRVGAKALQLAAGLCLAGTRSSRATVVKATEQGRAQQGEKEARHFLTSPKAVVSSLTFPPNETEGH